MFSVGMIGAGIIGASHLAAVALDDYYGSSEWYKLQNILGY